VIASTVCGQLILRLGYRTIVLTGMGILTVGAIVMAFLGSASSWVQVVAAMALLGVGMGLSVTAYLIAVQSAVRRDELGIATSGLQFSRSMGGTVGVSVMGAVMARQLVSGLALLPGAAALGSDFNPQALVQQSQAAQLPSELIRAMRELLADALHPVFLLALFAVVLALVISLLTPAGRASQLAAARDAEAGASIWGE
jgi:MFS family permease